MQVYQYLELLSGVLAVFFGSLIFVNVIEYAAFEMKWPDSFMGSIVSPFFTSFPEFVVFIMALLLPDKTEGHEIATGVIFGEPFISSSLAYTLVLLAILPSFIRGNRRSSTLQIGRSLSYPYLLISILYPLLLLAGYVSREFDLLLGVVFLVSYAYYVRLMRAKAGAGMAEIPADPYLSRFISTGKAELIQIVASIAILFYGSELVVVGIGSVSLQLGLSPLTLAILVVPFATIIPETMTAMIWGYRGKDSLAVGSLVGEKVLYSTLYPGIALLIFPLVVNDSAVISVIATETVSLIYGLLLLRGRFPAHALSLGLIFFSIFAYLVL